LDAAHAGVVAGPRCVPLVLAAAAAAWAQDPDAIVRKGFHSDRSYFSPLPFEHFDPVTGNVLLTFTDLELPGNGGRSLRFQRTYNAQGPAGPSTSGPGYWTFGIAGIATKVYDRPRPASDGSFQFGGLAS
jgi:hypothetical protein